MNDKPGNYQSRKFLLVCWLILSSQMLLLWGWLSPDTYAEVSLWALGLYFGANVSTRIGSAKFGL